MTTQRQLRPAQLGQNYLYCLALLFLVLLLISHLWPQQVFPLRGVFVTIGLMLLAIVTLLFQLITVHRSQSRIANNGWLGLTLYILFLVWLLVCWLSGPVPALAIDEMGNFLMGFWVMGIIWLLVVGCRSLDSNSQSNFSSRVRNFFLFICGYFVLLALVSSLKAIYQYFWGFERNLRLVESLGKPLWDARVESGILYALREKRVFASFGNPNVFCGFLAISMPFVWTLFFLVKHKMVKLLFIPIIVVMVFSAYLSKSRGGALMLLLACVLSILFLRRQISWKGMELKKVGLIVIMLFILLMSRPLICETEGSTIGRLTAISTVKERANYLLTAWRIIRLSPLWGSGLGSYEIYYPRYKAIEARETKYAHNFVAQLWADTGLLGLLLLGLFVFLCCRIAFSSRNRPKATWLFITPGIAIVIFLFDSLIDYTFYFREVFLDFSLCAGFLLGIGASAQEPERPFINRNFNKIFSIIFLSSVLSGIIIVTYPQVASIYSNKGNEQIVEGKLDNAVSDYEMAIALQPNNPWYHHQLGRAYIDRDLWEAGIQRLETAKRLNPYSAFISHELAMVYMKARFLKTALKYEREATQLYPLKADYHFHFSVLLSLVGDHQQAIKEARKALDLEYDKKKIKTIEEHLNTLKLKGEER